MARKLSKFIIYFDNDNLLYFPGQFISGKVLVELEEDTSIVGVFFHIVGEGVVSSPGRQNNVLNDQEDYVNFKIILHGEPDGKPTALPIGAHSFPFKLGLPLGLPSTFLGKHGWVQYFCKAAIREASGLTHKNQQVFIVMNPIDLNHEPRVLGQPFHCEIEHKLGITCFSQGPVSCRVRLDRGGYVPGETISIWASIRNQSKVTIKKTRAMLTETIQYLCRNRVLQTELRELSSVSRGKIKSQETDEWKNEHLYIPPLPPTNLRGCHIIRIQYDVFFIIEPSNFEKDIKLQLPIMMATYPYKNSDGTIKKKHGYSYPASLPILRPLVKMKSMD